MEVASEIAVKDGARKCTGAQDKHLGWMGILSSKTERSGVLVVKLVDMFVQWSPMKSLVSKVVEHVLKDEEKRQFAGT